MPNIQETANEPESVYLHLGAHKTGTTSFQHTLGLNAPELAKSGVATWIKARGKAPNGRSTYGLTHALNRRAAGKITQARALERLSDWIGKQPDRATPVAILSDENFLGDMREFFAGDGFYEGCGDRLSVFQDHLGPRLKRVTVVTRPMLDWIGSGAGYYALSGLVYSNEELVRLAKAETRTWATIVTELQQAAPHVEIHVVDYGSRGDDRTLAAHLCPVVELTALSPELNASISPEGMRDAIQGKTGETQGKFETRDASKPRWRPDWPEDLSLRFEEQYRSDFKAISALPNVTTVEKTPVS